MDSNSSRCHCCACARSQIQPTIPIHLQYAQTCTSCCTDQALHAMHKSLDGCAQHGSTEIARGWYNSILPAHTQLAPTAACLYNHCAWLLSSTIPAELRRPSGANATSVTGSPVTIITTRNTHYLLAEPLGFVNRPCSQHASDHPSWGDESNTTDTPTHLKSQATGTTT